eukprot:GEMP01080092.1.p1 GENE.GEMP01080092.1~~GEMP01080092.1.p1  ORF type:complete len:162 (+),score=16.08 GEMP01080092.1:480-965(+)
MPPADSGKKPSENDLLLKGRKLKRAQESSLSFFFIAFGLPRRLLLWLDTLSKVFGARILWLLFASQHVLKGFCSTFTLVPMNFLYKSYHITGPQMQIYTAVAALPWALKPIIGLFSDLLPIQGYALMRSTCTTRTYINTKNNYAFAPQTRQKQACVSVSAA